MTGQNDQQDESLTGEVHDQAGHCPAVILSPVLEYKSGQVCRKIRTILTVLALGAVLS